jgi:hypothetical protein
MSIANFLLVALLCMCLAASFAMPVRKWPFMAADLPHIHPMEMPVPAASSFAISNGPPNVDYSFLNGYHNAQLAAVRAWHQHDDAAWYFAARRNLLLYGGA